ncbi:MAG: hypothetical protein Ct9H90mP20_2880 [Candidatus Neomarinimicrobiota bacterium]|nr:MAG: hypothetical protein Ct9H90mP20_2880 [Candidatus Neomarinimicrobiota bacterium]
MWNFTTPSCGSRKDNMGNDIVVSGEGTGIVHMAPGVAILIIK